MLLGSEGKPTGSKLSPPRDCRSKEWSVVEEVEQLGLTGDGELIAVGYGE